MIESILNYLENVLGPGYYHIIFEIGLILVVYRLFTVRPKRSNSNFKLSPKERQQLIDEWEPEPLTPEVEDEKCRIVESSPGLHVIINKNKCVNFASFNYLSFLGNEEITNAAKAGIRKYGVGSCGPRGFFGTFDAHLNLEEKLAKFIGVEEAILYSYGFSTIASAIPAYSKSGDVIFVDEEVSFAIQQGIRASKSKVRYFKHNDVQHLEELLINQQNEDTKNPRAAKVTRKFIIAEGIYTNTGELCPLPKLIEFKYRFKVRIFLEESNSFGVIGKTGRGATEHFNVDPVDIDLIVAELERSLGSIGGFCAGTTFIIDHQRLSGAGYCFSASLPPYLARVAETAIQILQNEPQRLEKLKHNCVEFTKLLEDNLSEFAFIRISGHPESPLKHLSLKQSQISNHEEDNIFKKIIEFCEINGIAIIQSAKVAQDNTFDKKTIRLSISSGMSEENLLDCISKLKQIISKIDIPL